MKTEILYGIHPVWEALQAARRDFYEMYIAAEQKISKRIEMVLSFSETLSIPIKAINRSKLHALAGTDLHQGIGARVSPYPLSDIELLTGKSRNAHADRLILLLDGIIDPHNLGALARTALCAGLDAIIIPKDRSAPLSPAVSKASSGALEHMHTVLVANMVNTIKRLKEKGMWILGLDRYAKTSVYHIDLAGSLALVIGGEDKGIRPLVKKNCDLLVSIPQCGPVKSLNASAAGAVVMYEAFRQRQVKSGS